MTAISTAVFCQIVHDPRRIPHRLDLLTPLVCPRRAEHRQPALFYFVCIHRSHNKHMQMRSTPLLPFDNPMPLGNPTPSQPHEKITLSPIPRGKVRHVRADRQIHPPVHLTAFRELHALQPIPIAARSRAGPRAHFFTLAAHRRICRYPTPASRPTPFAGFDRANAF